MVASQLEVIMSQVQQLPASEQAQIAERVLALLECAAPPPLRQAFSVAERPVDELHFRRLAEQWRRETEHVSSLKQACLHPAYQRIIGLGPAVVPALLRELEHTPDHWFWALKAITDEDPAQAEDSFEGARRAWLQWGRTKGYL